MCGWGGRGGSEAQRTAGPELEARVARTLFGDILPIAATGFGGEGSGRHMHGRARLARVLKKRREGALMWGVGLAGRMRDGARGARPEKEIYHINVICLKLDLFDLHARSPTIHSCGVYTSRSTPSYQLSTI